MSGFGNIGTGLAGFMQGYQNSQREAAQRALQQQAIEQIQRALAGDRLLANTIFGGGIGNPTPQPSMPGTPSVPSFPQGGGGGAPPIPPAPAVPPPVPQAPTLQPAAAELIAGHDTFATPGQPRPFGDDAPIPPPAMQGEQIDGSRPIMRQDLPPPEPAASKGLQQPLSEEEYQRQYPDGILGPPGGFHTPAGAATTTSTPSGSAGSGGGGAEQASAAGGSPATGGSSANSSLFQQLLDPNHAYKALGEMRDRIAASAPPGTDPAVIWEATQQLYKLTNGGATERAQLAAYLKMAGLDVKTSEGALNRGSREDIAAANRGSREKIVDTQIQGRKDLQGNAIAAGDRRQERKFTQQEMMEDRKQKAINERQERRLAQSLEIANRKLAASPNNPELKRYTAQLNAIKAERDGILAKSRVKTPGGWFSSGGTLGLSDEEKKKVDELNQQIEGIAKQIAGSK